tara:strand:- start:100 stop:504 length:405 start_codon:yes stop_codon:yes gene_type:complete
MIKISFRASILFAIALTVMCFDHVVAQATDQDTAYVQILSDIPLAPGLSLEDDSEVVFDVPEGKIVEVTTFGSADLLETQTFYKESLEALGWKQVPEKEWSYKRDEEFLEISFEDGEDDLQVKFRLMPSSTCSK